MLINCLRCNEKFDFKEQYVIARNSTQVYLKCPRCGKPLTVSISGLVNREETKQSNKGQIPVFITRDVRQQLLDLHYSNQDIDGMKPERAHEIIRLQQKKKPEAPQSDRKEQNNEVKEVPGWIVVHDEETHHQILPLSQGENIIGRKSSTKPVPIPIETSDMYMGRWHCKINVVYDTKKCDYNFEISDLSSLNGTILNGEVKRKLHEKDIFYLRDGDTFQLGMTKIVFKKNKGIGRKDAVAGEVLASPYRPTVKLDNDKIHVYMKKSSKESL